MITHLHKIRLKLLIPTRNQLMDFGFEFQLFVVWVGHIPFREPGFALAVLDEDVADLLFFFGCMLKG
jgi:hypothetical protein